MTDEPLIDSPVYSRIMFALTNAHRVVTAQVVDGRLPTRLDPVLEAIDAAILATQEARHG